MGGNGPSIPPPIDYTPAMMMATSASMTAALGEQGVQTYGIMAASQNRSEITAAHLQEGLARLDEKLDEAKLGSRIELRGEKNRHEEAVAKIKDDHEEKMAELKKPNNVDTTNFLA